MSFTGFDNGTMTATNVDFRQLKPVVPQITADGDLLIGAAVSPFIRKGNLTSSDSSITWTFGPGTISGQVTGGTSVGKTITGNSGGALSPTAGNWNILGASVAAGTSPLAAAGSGSTLTLNVQRAQALAAADSTKVGVCNFNSTQFTVDANGFVSAAFGGFTWTETSGAFAAAAEHGYFITTTATATLPASPSEGDTIRFSCDTTNLLTITANTGQTIRLGTAVSSSAGTLISTQRGDSIELVYKSTGTVWIAQNSVGGWNAA